MADKKFTLIFDASMDVSKVKDSVSKIQSALNEINLSKGLSSSASGVFKKLLAELDNYNTLTSQAATSMADIKKADKSLQTILDLFDKINNIAKEVGADPINFINPTELKKINAAKKALESAKQAMSNTSIAAKKANLQEQFDKAKKKVEDLNSQISQLNNKIASKKASKTNIEASLEKAKEDLAELKKELANLEANPVKAETRTTSKKGVKTTENLNAQEVENYKNKLNETKAKINDTERAIIQLNKDLQSTDTSKMEEELEQVEQKAKEATQTMTELGEKLKHVGKDNRTEVIKKLRDELADLTGRAKKDIPQSIDKIEEFIKSLSEVEKAKVAEALNKINVELAETSREGKNASDGLKKTNEEGEQLTRTAQDIEHLKNQVLDFFSISNTIQIFKNAIRDAFDTVKELDAVMTETAVVTDFSIGDMWDKLPEYAEQANKLGASIKNLYAANTLYYQQGLNSQQAMSVGVETMKMARIANMDAAKATEAMTAALRGFNMEINETSASRINDVYSELAAITASDTEQIATAMSKTASIAASANMEFETTAALLAQIVETTQEAPETAGTAMKTIIARFTEVKQLFDEGMLSGEDTEGEEININKIDTALKTVGISLKDFLNGSKGIDDIFLELASKWDSLDLATQRYIATAAAGSRQQSRFIAMMSNYGRTMELVNAANNSAGASQKQFDKTTESLEAKIQRLKNAWAEFTMGLANNSLIKSGVDLLTDLLTTINNLTDAGDSKIGKFTTSLLRLGTVLIGLKGGQSAINGILKFLTNSGVADILGMKGIDGGKVDFFAAIKKAATSLGESLTKTKIGLAEILVNLKDPVWWGGSIKALGAALKSVGKVVLGFLKTWGGWIALIIGVGLAIKTVATAFNEAQKAAKMEKLQESMSKLAEEAEQAKSELNEITSSRKNLENMEDTLNDLTKGTDEWKQSLIAVNQEVLRLIDQYPELGKYVTTGQNGQLSIDSKGWDKIYSQQLQLITNISGLQSTTTAQIKELQAGMEFDNFVVASQESEADKKLAETELKLADFYDKKIFGNFTWGDLLLSGGGTGFGVGAHREIKDSGGYTADTQRSYTGGLNQQQYTDFARALTESGITMADGLTSEELKLAQQIYSNSNYDPQFINAVIEKAQELGQTFDDLGNKSLSLALQEETASKNFIRNAVSSADELAELEYGDAITEFLAGVKNYEDLTTEIEAEKQRILSKSPTSAELMQQYATMYGKYYADGKLYTDSSMSNQIEGLSDDYLANAIASANITVQIKKDALQIAQTGLKGKNTELFDDLFSASGSEITSKQIAKYSQEDDYNFDQVAMDMGFTSLEDMATQLETTVEDLTETLTENFESATDRIAKQRRDLTKQMSKYSSKDLQGYEANAAILSALEMKFGEQIRYTLDNIISSLEASGDQALISKGYEQFRNVAMTGNEEDVQKLYSFVKDIDWSNPIDTVYTLNQEIQKGSDLTSDYAKSMIEIESSFFGAGNQMQYFLKSNDFKEMQEDLTEIVELNGELTASDVLDLADDYKSLNKILKNTEATAGGVAKALQLVAEGKLGIYQLTDAVMASLEGFDSLDSLIAETLKILEEFDPGPNENEVAEFINTAYETISANLKAGAVGNTQNFSYLDFLFPGWRDDKEGDELVAQMEYLTGKLEDNAINMRRSWSDIHAGKDIYGKDIQFDEDSGRSIDDLSVQDTGSEILLTGWESKGMTTNDIVDWIADAYEVSDNYARMMLADFKNYSADLAVELNANDYAASIGKAYEELNMVKVGDVNAKAVVDKKIIDESEIAAIATLYNQSFDTVYNDFKNRGALITDFYDENGMLEETAVIIAELDKVAQSGGAEGAKWVKQFIDASTSNLNIDELNEGLGNVGIPEEAKARITQDIIDSMMAASNAESMMVDVTLSDGSTTALEITPNINLETAIANAETELANSKLAESIVSAFSNVTISPQVDTENMTSYVISAIKAADGTTVVIAPDQESLNAITSSVTDAVQSAKPYVQVNSNINSIISSINSISRTVTVTVKYQEVGKPSRTSGSGGNAADPNFFVNNAVGVKNAHSSYNALVSEEGPELIQTEDGAYLTGQNGPEFAHINKGDTVYTAEETAQIFKNRKHTLIPRHASGYGNGTAYQGTGNGGKGSGDSNKDTWENPFDKLYNLVREIDEELRRRERLERRYEKLLESVDLTAGKLFDNAVEQLKQLEKEKLLNKELQEGRRSQIQQYQKENADLMKYAKVIQNEHGEDVLRINWDQINLVEDPEQGQRIEDYVRQLEEWFDSLEEAEDKLNDIEDRIEEVKELGKEEYLDFENSVKDAIIFAYQEEIDKLSEINESINDTNTQLIDAISKQVNRIRQQRENERTEQELQEKQRQLLYLSQDTSGANDLAILGLRKEIEEGTVDYTDTLIDQKIDELQMQNDEAAEQREQQITLMQAQLDHLINSGEIWDEVYTLMDEGLDPEAGLIRGSRLEQILKSAENFDGMSKVQQMDWLKELQQQAAQAVVYMRLTTEKIDTAVELNRQNHFGATTPEPEYSGSSSGGSGGGSGGGGSSGGGSSRGYTQNPGYTKEQIKSLQQNAGISVDGIWGSQTAAAYDKGFRPSGPSNRWESENSAYWDSQKGNNSSNNSGNSNNSNKTPKQVVIYYSTAKKTVTYDYNSDWQSLRKTWEKQWGPSSIVEYKYKQGGLADFTGPAWLDGTKSRPELVLNQKDTQNFIQLKDILASLMTGSQASTENNGDITYDIDINVESIGSDYDVEQVANKVKSLINEDARYRNNNTVSLKR